jgi:phage tail sheath protein FI
MLTYLNPGIYSAENLVLTPQVVEVETALPAFVGYTDKAIGKEAKNLMLVPTKINSMREFEFIFGFPFENKMELTIDLDSSEGYFLSHFEEPSLKYILYYSLKIYFENGGGPCYILSVDTYQNPQEVLLEKPFGSSHSGLLDGLHQLAKVSDISLIVIPEAIKLSADDFSLLVQAALLQCHTLGNRFAIFDFYNGDQHDPDINLNRGLFGTEYLNYGSAYYPFVRTTMNAYVNSAGSNVKVTYKGKENNLGQLKNTENLLFKFVKSELKSRFIDLPSCGAVAGAYVTSDKNRGVWKSPANLSLAGVMEPLVPYGNQGNNVSCTDPDAGKSINNIRYGIRHDTQLCGARTLEIHDIGERFVSVSRFQIMVKESLKTSTGWVIFEPNNSNTWQKICHTIEKYLTLKWQVGALAGIIPQQAFYVKCGLGDTMTSDDLIEGRIHIEVGLAVLSPAEFNVFRFSHDLKSTKSFTELSSESLGM